MKAKRKPVTTKLRKIVEERRFIDAETGEEDSIPVISMEEKDCNFQKIFLGHILDAINSIGNQKIKVLMWMIENRDAENRIVGTHRSIAEVTGCAKQTVTSVIKSLMEHDVIRLVQQGVYQLNPDVIWKGSHGKRKRVLLDYGKSEEKSSKPNSANKGHIRLI
jgi:hypothetical protein